ncbi:membrane protein insertase YidC [Dermatophilus congolensis]|uniref:membrane protein insertase YidC n=1 Tax=Dermatophilus congolensis TaxID=1863 RepID=UPI001AAE253C|nr:membrane protein insertase YidC [Dermatophilus congolensis]MBO3142547.1 membrane protein insertase YidC [Dermatophilus congolensis]MBO3151536.1 membrane protein insertase YidC [Dermatophilus congolensis]MBO3161461.1 membrane protein insertase YidC [Dermatophilus congolensis]MBO3162821.1 membrane protein insertase YidC [Dermatophilus congolensis]MBO3176375.1 membrane protein insertase YidC [Dermatophilus congolensis]
MPNLLYPFDYAISTVLAAAHSALAAVGFAPNSALTWVLSIAVLVVVVRAVMLPLTIHGVKLAQASGRARPALNELRKKYEGKTDLESLKAMRAEQMAIQAEHGMSSIGCLPLLLQIPIMWSLYQVLQHVANGDPIGVMTRDLVASMRSGRLVGVSLADRIGGFGNLFSSPGHFAVIITLAVLSAALIYITQKRFVLANMSLEGMPEGFADVQKMMPLLSSVGILVAAVAVPVGLLVYWVVSNALTLVQTGIITTWFPTPYTPAAEALARRRGQQPSE